MNKMYQAVKDFVSPLIYTSIVECEGQIVGVLSETRLDDAVKVYFAKTSDVKRGDWDNSQRVQSITFLNNGREMSNNISIEALDCGIDIQHRIINSSYTMFLEVVLENSSANLILIALDLETLETYVVNKLN